MANNDKKEIKKPSNKEDKKAKMPEPKKAPKKAEPLDAKKATPPKKDAKDAKVDKKAAKAEPKKETKPDKAAAKNDKKPAKSEPAKKENTKVKVVEVDDENEDTEKYSVKAYHISFRADENKWQVKLAKGERALALFNHQSDAIEFAKEKAKNQDGFIVIHKRSGQIRTQHYGKE